MTSMSADPPAEPPVVAGAVGPEMLRPMRSGGRADATRRAILDAARAVFAEHGYADAGIAEIVTRSNASVGSIYHHFGGKAELYLALYDQFVRRNMDRASAAVRQAREVGETDPMALFCAGGQAYLEGCLEQRDIVRVFFSGDGPPDFDRVRRQAVRDWIRRNDALFRIGQQPYGKALTLVLTTIMAEAGREVVAAEEAGEARLIGAEVLALVRRLGPH